MSIKIKRIYAAAPARGDGKRILVDRVWPRGVSRDAAKLDAWLKDIAPTADLRKWFGHDPDKWNEFYDRYWEELDAHEDDLDRLRKWASAGAVTLLYGAKDERHNQAVVLRDRLQGSRPS